MGGNPSFNDDTRLRGNTDSALIGNIDDRLKVTNIGAGNPQGPVSTSKYRIDSGGPIGSIGTTYVTVYTYSGTGLFYGFYLDFNDKDVEIKLTIDGEQILELELTASTSGNDDWCGLGVNSSDDVIKFCATPYPILYDTNVTIEVRRTDNANKTLQNYLVWISKET